jgi:hypothetical protein
MPLQVDPSSYGNLFVKIVVDFPNSISDEQKKGIYFLCFSCSFLILTILHSFWRDFAMIVFY